MLGLGLFESEMGNGGDGGERRVERDDFGAEYRSIILIKRITPNRRTRREEAR